MQGVRTMSRENRSPRLQARTNRVKPSPKRLNGVQIASRIFLVAVVISLLGLAIGLVYRAFNIHGDSASVALNLPVNQSLNPLEAAALSAYMGVNRDQLNKPKSDDPTLIKFEVQAGETAGSIADGLVAQGLIENPELFRNYLRYYGLDRQLEAGSYQLSASMTIPQIALTLTEAIPNEITVRVTEGWRREQIAESIAHQVEIPFSSNDFLAATGAGAPVPPELAAIIPPNTSLEGFLFPDTYRLATDATAADLVSKMARNFDGKVTSQMRTDVANTGFTLYQLITLASIVEREAAVAEERPIIASVYFNRLRQGLKLEADPTVQYAMGYQSATGQWWNLNLNQSDYISVDSPYNTYLYIGLPPGPIANPGLDSIRAVIYPAQTNYLFFRAACDGSAKHRFAATYEEHISNECP